MGIFININFAKWTFSFYSCVTCFSIFCEIMITRTTSREWFPKFATGLNVHFTTTSGRFLPTTWITFTKLKFRRSFWGAEWVCFLIVSKVMTEIQKTKNVKNGKNIKQITSFFSKIERNGKGDKYLCFLS